MGGNVITRTARAMPSFAALVLAFASALVLAGPAAAWAVSGTPTDPSTPASSNARPPASTQGDGKGLPHWLWVGGLGFCAVVIVIVALLALRGVRDRESRAG
jgi:hypothetical protein